MDAWTHRRLPQISEDLWKTAAWLSGTLGDVAVRNLDQTNFGEKKNIMSENENLAWQSIEATATNPSNFYSATTTLFTCALLQSADLHSAKGVVGLATAAICLSGMGGTLVRAYQAAKGKLPLSEINNGFSNYASATANIALTLFSFASGQYPLGIAQAIFGVGAIKALYETRCALTKTKPPDLSVPNG